MRKNKCKVYAKGNPLFDYDEIVCASDSDFAEWRKTADKVLLLAALEVRKLRKAIIAVLNIAEAANFE